MEKLILNSLHKPLFYSCAMKQRIIKTIEKKGNIAKKKHVSTSIELRAIIGINLVSDNKQR